MRASRKIMIIAGTVEIHPFKRRNDVKEIKAAKSKEQCLVLPHWLSGAGS